MKENMKTLRKMNRHGQKIHKERKGSIIEMGKISASLGMENIRIQQDSKYTIFLNLNIVLLKVQGSRLIQH